ncbi:hypothetical protein LRP88_12662 [Fusarium phalaenopsidis]
MGFQPGRRGGQAQPPDPNQGPRGLPHAATLPVTPSQVPASRKWRLQVSSPHPNFAHRADAEPATLGPRFAPLNVSASPRSGSSAGMANVIGVPPQGDRVGSASSAEGSMPEVLNAITREPGSSRASSSLDLALAGVPVGPWTASERERREDDARDEEARRRDIERVGRVVREVDKAGEDINWNDLAGVGEQRGNLRSQEQWWLRVAAAMKGGWAANQYNRDVVFANPACLSHLGMPNDTEQPPRRRGPDVFEDESHMERDWADPNTGGIRGSSEGGQAISVLDRFASIVPFMRGKAEDSIDALPPHQLPELIPGLIRKILRHLESIPSNSLVTGPREPWTGFGLTSAEPDAPMRNLSSVLRVVHELRPTREARIFAELVDNMANSPVTPMRQAWSNLHENHVQTNLAAAHQDFWHSLLVL